MKIDLIEAYSHKEEAISLFKEYTGITPNVYRKERLHSLFWYLNIFVDRIISYTAHFKKLW